MPIPDHKAEAQEANPFLQSLDTLSAHDIGAEQYHEKKRRTDPVRLVIIVFCVAVLAYSLWQIGQQIAGYLRADDIYGSLLNDFYAADSLPGGGDGAVPRLLPSLTALPTANWGTEFVREQNTPYETVVNTDFEVLRAKLNYLADRNPDTYGWIRVENTNIDYPVVRGEDNDYYLNHAFTRVGLPAGSIFADYRTLDDLSGNYNVVLYGHNMSNGQMFHDVSKYLEEDFFFENPYITLTTFNGVFTYEVFAVYKADMASNYNRTAFLTRQEFIEFAEDCDAKSLYHRDGITFGENDRLLTLSTCTGSTSVFWRDRYALHAKLIRAELAY